MNSLQLLLPALLLGSCASTSAPVTYALAPLPPELEVRHDPRPEASTDSFAFALVEPVVTTPPAQDAGTAWMPANRHQYSLGAGVRFRDGDSAVTLNGNYRYWINEPLEVGLLADWAFSPISTLLIAPAVWWHPNERLTILGAPGVELESGEDTVSALRVGAAYRLMLENAAIRPFFYYDFIDERENAFAVGISIGI